MGPYVILFAVGALHDHVANNDIRDAQHAIEFCNLGGISVEIDEGVDTVGQTIDLVSEFTLAPLVNVVDGTSADVITPGYDSSYLHGFPRR